MPTPQTKPDYPLGSVDAEVGHSITDKLFNECYVLAHGLSDSIPGMQHAASDAWDHKGETAIKIAISTGLGLGIGLLAGRTGTLGLLGRGVGAAAAMSFLMDGAKPIAVAGVQAWNAKHQSDLDHASGTLGNGLGAFAVDTIIQTPGAILGGALATKFSAGQMGLWRSWRNSRSSIETKIADPASGLNVGPIEAPHAVIPEVAPPVVGNRSAPRAAVVADIIGQQSLATGESTAFLGRDLQLTRAAAVAAELPAPPVQVGNPIPVTTVAAPESRIVTAVAAPEPRIVTTVAAPEPRIAAAVAAPEPRIVTTTARPEPRIVTTSSAPESTTSGGKTLKSGNGIQENANATKTSPGTNESGADVRNTDRRAGQPAEKPPAKPSSTTGGGGSDRATDALDATDRVAGTAVPKIPDGGFKFVEIKPTDKAAPHFDLGVGIDEAAVLGDKPNLRPRNMKSGQSLALNALYMPKKELPSLGGTIAITDRNPDSLTALAILANRAEKRRVDDTIVKLLAGDGKTGDVSATAQTGVNAIRHISEQDGVKIGDRVRYISAVLDHTVTPKDLADAAGAFENASPVALPEGVLPSRPTGVRSLNGPLLLEYVQGSDQARGYFDFAIGTNDRNIIGDARVIDREGSLNIVQRVLRMSADELPAPGSRGVMGEVDVPRLTAAAIIENKLEGKAMRNSLIDLVLRDGAWTERVPEGERANVVAAYQAMEGFANDPHISPRRKVAAIKELLTADVPAAELQPIIDEFQIFRPSQQPFKYVRTTQFKPKPFDFGVEITDPELIGKQPNLDHHGEGATIHTPSAAEQALALPESEWPALGARVAIQKPDADSLTAVAVLANRRAGLPVNERLVEAVGRRDRGYDTDTEGKPFSDVETPFIALRSFARNRNVLIGQRIAAIRALLAGMTRESELRGLTERFHQNQWSREVHAEKTSTITDQIPGKLAYVETPRENWFEARDLGLKHAPVAVIAARDSAGANHFEVVARADHPAGEQLGGALADLSKMEPGWGGRSNIFVSPSDSRLTPEQVLAVVSAYIDKAGH